MLKELVAVFPVSDSIFSLLLHHCCPQVPCSEPQPCSSLHGAVLGLLQVDKQPSWVQIWLCKLLPRCTVKGRNSEELRKGGNVSGVWLKGIFQGGAIVASAWGALGLNHQRAQRSAALWIHSCQYLLSGEGGSFVFPHPLTSVETSQGDELITTCTYNTEGRSKVTVVSAALEELKSVQTGLNQKQEGGGGGKGLEKK